MTRAPCAGARRDGRRGRLLLCSDDEEHGDWPESAGRDITWQQAKDCEDTTEPAVVLWSGEVLLNIGRGLAGLSTRIRRPPRRGRSLLHLVCRGRRCPARNSCGGCGLRARRACCSPVVIGSSGGSIAFGWRRSAPPPSSKFPSPVGSGRAWERSRDRVETETAQRQLRLRFDGP